MKQAVKVREKLTVYVMDMDGNIIHTEELKPPANKLEEIASKLGILKRANTMQDFGLETAGKRFIGMTADPVEWLGAYSSTASDYIMKSATYRDVTVTGSSEYTAVINNQDDTWNYQLGGTTLSTIIGCTKMSSNTIANSITGLEVRLRGGDSVSEAAHMWVEIEYEFQ